MWKILRPPKHKPPVAAEKIDKEYKRLRLQVFIGIFIGYAGYYLVRKNFTLAMPHLVEMGFDKGDLGIALSANAIAYGLSKFLMGGVSDRSNARVFQPLGLVLSALVTMFLGTSAGISSIIMMFITQFLIGWFRNERNILLHVGSLCRAEQCSSDTRIADRELHGKFLNRIADAFAVCSSLRASARALSRVA